jgi:hypothetical protein
MPSTLIFNLLGSLQCSVASPIVPLLLRKEHLQVNVAVFWSVPLCCLVDTDQVSEVYTASIIRVPIFTLVAMKLEISAVACVHSQLSAPFCIMLFL